LCHTCCNKACCEKPLRCSANFTCEVLRCSPQEWVLNLALLRIDHRPPAVQQQRLVARGFVEQCLQEPTGCGAAANLLCMRLCGTVPPRTNGPLRCSGKSSLHAALWISAPKNQRASAVQRCLDLVYDPAAQRLSKNLASQQQSGNRYWTKPLPHTMKTAEKRSADLCVP
jgi:hypothetical protein